MSDNFGGFSQDEINKVSGVKNQTGLKDAFRGNHLGIRRVTAPPSKKQQVPPKMTQNKVDTGAKKPPTANKIVKKPATTKTSTAVVSDREDDDTLDNVNLDRSMSRSMEEALFYQPKRATLNPSSTTSSTAATSNGHNGNLTSRPNDAAIAADDSSILKLPPNMDSDISSTTETHSSNDSSILCMPTTRSLVASEPLNVDSPFKGISLKDFESHRRMIEEQNNQKKELLKKAIELHSRKTAAETRKIEEIKSELSKLDNDLAVDVAILRKQIDAACINFANIEKQYIKIEAQFLKSKIDLHNAAEKKELLTEHLCTVIAHNEDRKAEKLSELMEKVGITAPIEEEYTAPTTTTPDDNGMDE